MCVGSLNTMDKIVSNIFTCLTKASQVSSNAFSENDIKQHISIIKAVTKGTSKRGDIAIPLCALQRSEEISIAVRSLISKLLDCSDTSYNEILGRMIDSSTNTEFPITQFVVQNRVLCVWLHKPSVFRKVINDVLRCRREYVANQSLILDFLSEIDYILSFSHCPVDASFLSLNPLSMRLQSIYGCNSILQAFVSALMLHSVKIPSSYRFPHLLHTCLTYMTFQQIDHIIPSNHNKESKNPDISTSTFSLESFDMNLREYRRRIVIKHILAIMTASGATVSQNIFLELFRNNTHDYSILRINSRSLDKSSARPIATESLGAIKGECSISADFSRRSPVRDVSFSSFFDSIVAGPVVSADDKKMLRENWSVQALLRHFYKELQAAGKCRADANRSDDQEYDGSSEDEIIRSYSWSCLNMLMLSTQSTSPLILDVMQLNNTRDCAFMLYNYARLNTLLVKFIDLNMRGVMDELPHLDSVDLSLLKETEEWELIWARVIEWPSVVSRMATEIRELLLSLTDPKVGQRKRPKVSSSLVFLFLHDLSHRFSVYYNRVRVLPAVRLPPHLVPLLHARIALLLTVLRTMTAAFALLGIVPPKHM